MLPCLEHVIVSHDSHTSRHVTQSWSNAYSIVDCCNVFFKKKKSNQLVLSVKEKPYNFQHKSKC